MPPRAALLHSCATYKHGAYLGLIGSELTPSIMDGRPHLFHNLL